jgi:hypothetical protein
MGDVQVVQPEKARVINGLEYSWCDMTDFILK